MHALASFAHPLFSNLRPAASNNEIFYVYKFLKLMYESLVKDVLPMEQYFGND